MTARQLKTPAVFMFKVKGKDLSPGQSEEYDNAVAAFDIRLCEEVTELLNNWTGKYHIRAALRPKFKPGDKVPQSIRVRMPTDSVKLDNTIKFIEEFSDYALNIMPKYPILHINGTRITSPEELAECNFDTPTSIISTITQCSNCKKTVNAVTSSIWINGQCYNVSRDKDTPCMSYVCVCGYFCEIYSLDGVKTIMTNSWI
jgi:hypothetical protein